MWAEAPGHAPSKATHATAEPDAPSLELPDVVLRTLREISGLVCDPTGRPMPNVEFSARVAELGGGGHLGPWPQPAPYFVVPVVPSEPFPPARSDRDGRWTLVFPSDSAIEFWISDLRYAEFRSPPYGKGEFPVREVRLVAHPAIDLAGRVRDPQGQPLEAEVRITLRGGTASAFEERKANTTSDGTFAFSRPAAGEWAVFASATGYRAASAWRRPGDPPVELVLERSDTGR